MLIFFHNFCYRKKVKCVPNRAVLKAYGPNLESDGNYRRWSLIDSCQSPRLALERCTSEMIFLYVLAVLSWEVSDMCPPIYTVPFVSGPKQRIQLTLFQNLRNHKLIWNLLLFKLFQVFTFFFTIAPMFTISTACLLSLQFVYRNILASAS